MRGLRWWIAVLVFLATVVNFLDRLTISILAPVITAQFGLTNVQFATISTWFLLAYALSQPFSGRLYDWIGTKRGFTLSILVWSAAGIAHAFARGFTSLSCMRFALGIGEAGNWPGAAKVMAEWFPVRQRALGMGIFNSGVAFGSILAPPLIVFLQMRFGWRSAFLVTGCLGFGWSVLWQLCYESPARHRALTPEEWIIIEENRDPPTSGRKIGWRELMRHREVWGILLSRFVTDPVWWFYITWLPLYLYNVRGFSLKQIGLFAWLPYVAAGAGSLVGGWLSGHWIARGWTVNRARGAVIVAGAAMMTAGVSAARAHSSMAALALIAVVLFGFQSWINNVQTLPSDFFPERVVASVAGLGGLGAGLGAILFTLATGWSVDHYHSYTPILTIAGLLPLLGTALLFAVGGPIRRAQLES